MTDLIRAALVSLFGLFLMAGLAVPSHASTNYKKIIDITFPVYGDTSYIDDYDQCRSGCDRRHKATDIMGAYGLPVHAAMGGTISWITGLDGPVPSYGYMISLNGDDGRTYHYVHLGRQDLGPNKAYASGMGRGVRVERGQHIGWLGCSGNASCTAPHLHFSIQEPGLQDPYGTDYLNPYRSLKDAQARGDLPHAGRFADVPLTLSHFTNIELIADAGITVGCRDKTVFCPDAPVTRAEMATFLTRAVPLKPVPEVPFSDVSVSSSHHDNIGAVYAAAITVGCKDKTVYCPDASVTRAEMASFLARALGLPLEGPTHFSDVPPSSSHSAAIGAIYERGITVGCGDKSTYCPEQPVSRAEMATFLARAFLGSGF